MGGIKLNVHPLFFAFGIYYAITGRIFLFLILTLSALLHETGHSASASNKGYVLDKITLMPFGAIVSGQTDGLKCKDEIYIALAGPFINFAVAIIFVAGWWVYPQSYAVTEIIVQTNLSLALINLLPAYPLDGGRVVFSLIKEKFGDKTAKIVCKTTGLVLGAILLFAFVLTIFNKINISLLFFSVFIIFGAFQKDKGRYVKLFACASTQNLKRGMPYKKQAVDSDCTVKTLIKILDENSINEIVVFKQGVPITTLSQQGLENLLQKSSVYDKIGNVLGV